MILLMTFFAAAGVAQNKKAEEDFRKLCSEVVNALAKKNMKAINKYINPKAGVFVIIRPGAIDDLVNYTKLDLKEPFPMKYPYKDSTVAGQHIVKYEHAPRYDCGDMKWEKTGFVADTNSQARISTIMDFRKLNEGLKYSQAEIAKKDLAEKRMRKVVFTHIAKEHGLVFYLSFIKGKWYLSVIDTTVGKCAA